jgi:transcriptional regulator with XRE-family HTH domain
MYTAKELLAANIRVKRKELGLTQEKLAESIGVSYQMVHDIEGCRTWVSDNTLQRLSEALKSDMYELLLPPPPEGNGTEKSNFKPQLVEQLHKAIKADIDRRLDDFFNKNN